jgi:hypothetical protein
VTWADVDGVRAYLAQGGGTRPSRKAVYQMVAQGLRVVRVGDEGRDTKGRRKSIRMRFALEWVDQFLEQRAPHRESAGGCAEKRASR